MKKNRLFLVVPTLILLIVALALTGCSAQTKTADMQVVTESGEIFYRNDLLTVGADPDVIYITEGEDAGYYLYRAQRTKRERGNSHPSQGENVEYTENIGNYIKEVLKIQ